MIYFNKFLGICLILAVIFIPFKIALAGGGGGGGGFFNSVVAVVNSGINAAAGAYEQAVGSVVRFTGDVINSGTLKHIGDNLKNDGSCRMYSPQNPFQNINCPNNAAPQSAPALVFCSYNCSYPVWPNCGSGGQIISRTQTCSASQTNCSNQPNPQTETKRCVPKILSFYVPLKVELSDSFNISWNIEGADRADISGNLSESLSGSNLSYGYKTLSTGSGGGKYNRGIYNFTLTAVNSGGSVSETRTVEIIQVPKCSFSANPSIITLPEGSTLSWNCQYASSCSIDQGIGSVSNTTGEKEVRPTQDTTYTLTCQGLDGSRSFSGNSGSNNSTVKINTPGTIIYKEVAPW